MSNQKSLKESALERMIIDKLQGIEDRIDQSISKKFEENYKNIDAKMNAVSESYANTIKRNLKPIEQAPNFRQILQEMKNEDLAQQKEREVGASNIIIHGLQETDDTIEGREEDFKIIKELLEAIEVTSEPGTVIRLGRRNETNSRPIKVKMNNQNERELIMCSLAKLKDGPITFKRISVTEDYTPEECQAIREKVQEAKSKTENEGQGKFVFKVRGTPKNGLQWPSQSTKNKY